MSTTDVSSSAVISGGRRAGSMRAFAAVAVGYWTTPGYRIWAWIFTVALILMGCAMVGVALWLNIWNRDFFNALEKRDLPALVEQLWVLAAIVVAGAATTFSQLHIKRRLQIYWRSWLSTATVGRWLNSGRQYQLGMLAEECDNPDGRIHEDIRIATEHAVEFAQSILQCILQLIIFLGVLWTLSGMLHLGFLGIDLAIPGYLVWAAIIYAVIGSSFTYLLGRNLIGAGIARQSREATYRASLIRARENAEGIALMRGEMDERAHLRTDLRKLRKAWHRQSMGQGNLALLTTSLAYLAPIVPLVLALPRYLSHEIALGGLMQTAQAFSSVQWALSWLIDNFPKFADWRASADRVVALHLALSDLEDTATSSDRPSVELRRGDGDRLVLKNLQLARPDGEALIHDAEVVIGKGERVLIRGQSGTGKSTLMRAVAGVWPWGHGEVDLPQGSMTFMPQKPYFPLGTLRDAMLYPGHAHGVSDELLRETLTKLGLEHLCDRLDEKARWDHILSGGEQQRVAFARVLLHKPDWIFLDEATSALDEASQEIVMKLIAEELAESSVVSIGHRPGLEAFHHRELVLVAGEDGAELRAQPRARAFRDLYRQIATIDHSGAVPRNRFWTGLRDYLARQRREERKAS
ncbi:MAG TPA: ABC transporter ATP-binding protein/permease [Reyranellaceae bacterium]|nr:ABC transporter ATP-binding protein/permease [Reyranellaceae bacterium]